MVNKVILIGNLGRDPEVRFTQSGQQVANFSMATSRKWRDRDGNRQEQTEWQSIVCWGRLAEIAGQYLCRGKKVYVEGRLQTSSWDDRETGEKKYRTEVVCESLQMLGNNGNGSSRDPRSSFDRTGSQSGYGPQQGYRAQQTSGAQRDDTGEAE